MRRGGPTEHERMPPSARRLQAGLVHVSVRSAPTRFPDRAPSLSSAHIELLTQTATHVAAFRGGLTYVDLGSSRTRGRTVKCVKKPGEPMATINEADSKCSFCGKAQAQVKKLVAGPGVYICD